jgi:energy-coupling factor transporter ATP-binding protein EcfA2
MDDRMNGSVMNEVMGGVALKDITFSYDGKTEILSHIDFTAYHGEVALVAGHSGEGKSTLMSIISGIIPNVTQGNLSGEVVIDGENMNGKRLGYICRKVGVVLQNADEQIIHKTVEDEIAFGLENLAFPPEKIAKQIGVVCNLMQLDLPIWTRRAANSSWQLCARLPKRGIASSSWNTGWIWCCRMSIRCGTSAAER